MLSELSVLHCNRTADVSDREDVNISCQQQPRDAATSRGLHRNESVYETKQADVSEEHISTLV